MKYKDFVYVADGIIKRLAYKPNTTITYQKRFDSLVFTIKATIPDLNDPVYMAIEELERHQLKYWFRVDGMPYLAHPNP